jgi:hypothetical protein
VITLTSHGKLHLCGPVATLRGMLNSEDAAIAEATAAAGAAALARICACCAILSNSACRYTSIW